MKKILIKILIILSIFIFPWNTLAAGGYSVSKNSISLTKGGTTTFTINASNAAGRVDISSSNSAVASVSTSSVFLDCNSTTITVTANSAGSAVIRVIPYDMATFDEEVIENSYQINVTVNEPAAPSQPQNPPQQPTTPSIGGGGNAPTDTRSNNTNLKQLKVNGKDVSIKDNNYVLEVSNYVDNIEISATTEDAKAKLSGTGKKDINVGNNNFSIIVTAENGTSKTYNLIVTRKEYNSLSDLDELISKNKEIEIAITEKDILTKEHLDKIRKSKKTIKLNKISTDKKILYSWILDGSKIRKAKDFNPNISTDSKIDENMDKAINYASGIYLDLSTCNDIPEGVILRYYVGDKYKDKEKINLYIYDEKTGKIIQLEKAIEVKEEYVELRVTDSVKHYLTKAEVINATSKQGVNIWLIISIILIPTVIVLSGYIIIKSKQQIKKVIEEEII